MSCDVFETSLQRFEQGLAHIHEEAHMLSYLFHFLGYPPGTANGCIKRIWTGTSFNNGEASDWGLAIWHLPSEKRNGPVRPFEAASAPNSMFWRASVGEPFRRHIGLRVRIPGRTWLDKELIGLEGRARAMTRATVTRSHGD
jgi:hypothetical protein